MPSGYSNSDPAIRNCDYCGSEYSNFGHRSRYCSSICRSRVRYQRERYRPECSLKRRLSAARNRAKTKGVPFNLDIEFLLELWEEQEGACILSGDEFYLGPSDEYVCHPQSPSLDRIIPEEGYVKGNVRLVTYQVNVALGEYGEKELINLARKILGVAR